MEREELKDLANSLANEYLEEMSGYYISTGKLTKLAEKLNPGLDEIWIRRMVGFATGLLYQWGPDTEEELEAKRCYGEE